MGQKCFLCWHPLKRSYYFLLFSLLIRITFSSVDPKFESCQPQSCGNGPNISFPFYIRDKQPNYCGYPRFDIFCGVNNYPTLNLSNSHYIIHEIFYNNGSLRVSDPAFLSSNSTNCFARAQNLRLYSPRFDLAPNQTDLFLLFGCDSKSLPQKLQQHRIGCSKGDNSIEKGSVLGFRGNGSELMDAIGSNKCENGVVRTTAEDTKEGVLGALRRGFWLKWTATNCSSCEKSGGKCGFDWEIYSFQCYCPDRPHSWHCRSGSMIKLQLRLALGLGGPLVVIAGGLIVMVYFLKWKKQSRTNQMIKSFLTKHGSLPIKRYNYSELKKMTNCFRYKLGQGGYGSVYKGQLHDGQLIAVKVLVESEGNGEEFINEVVSISRTCHINIVTLLGFCIQGSKRALIYELMPNGSLEKFLKQESIEMINCQLDCKKLFDITIGVARGLEYLHRGCNTRILHFDIKPHNILLDEQFCPKISDFGLAKICPKRESIISLTGARGTIGYIAPEVFSRNFGEVSSKSDVYSYGMMILEIVGGRKNTNVKVDCSSEIYFPHWIHRCLKLDQELELQCIKNESDKEMMKKMAIVGLWCIQIDPADRPTMTKVVEMLDGSLESLKLPPKPYISSPTNSPTHYLST